MNRHTRSNKKRKSTFDTRNDTSKSSNNRGRRLEQITTPKEQRMTVAGKMIGKRNNSDSQENGSINSDTISSMEDADDEFDDSQDISRCKDKEIANILLRLEGNMNKQFEEQNEKIKELASEIADLRCENSRNGIVNFDQSGTRSKTHPLSVVTMEGRKSISDLSDVENTVAYLKAKNRDIELGLNRVITQECFGRMKFLIDMHNPEDGENKEQPCSAAEKVVDTAIELNHISRPSWMNETEYTRNAVNLVKKLYNKRRSCVQQDIRKRWIGEYGSCPKTIH